MTQKILSYLSVLLCSFLLIISSVIAIDGSSSDGNVTASKGGMSATAVRGTSSDSSVSGRVSSGGSGISSSYADAVSAVTGSPGPDLSLTDPSTSSSSSSTTTSTAEEQKIVDEGGNIPNGGGGGGGSGAKAGSSAETESSPAEASSSETATEQQTEQTTSVSELAAESVSIAIELSEGSSLSLSPDTGVSRMTVLAVTETTATIIIDTSVASNQLTGGAVIHAQEETILQVGENVDADTDGDGLADLQITLSKIVYDEASQKYHAFFTTTYLHPTEETRAFIQQQVDSGEVALAAPPEKFSETQRWAIIAVGLLVLLILFVIILSLYEKKRKKILSSLHSSHEEMKLSKQEQQHSPKEETKGKEKAKEEKAAEIKSQSFKPSVPLLLYSRSSTPLFLLPSLTKSSPKIISKQKKKRKQKQKKNSRKKTFRKNKLRSHTRRLRNKKNKRKRPISN